MYEYMLLVLLGFWNFNLTFPLEVPDYYRELKIYSWINKMHQCYLYLMWIITLGLVCLSLEYEFKFQVNVHHQNSFEFKIKHAPCRGGLSNSLECFKLSQELKQTSKMTLFGIWAKNCTGAFFCFYFFHSGSFKENLNQQTVSSILISADQCTGTFYQNQ